jgi:hypothetical protein
MWQNVYLLIHVTKTSAHTIYRLIFEWLIYFWKEHGEKQLYPNLSYHSGTHLESLSKTTKYLKIRQFNQKPQAWEQVWKVSHVFFPFIVFPFHFFASSALLLFSLAYNRWLNHLFSVSAARVMHRRIRYSEKSRRSVSISSKNVTACFMPLKISCRMMKIK